MRKHKGKITLIAITAILIIAGVYTLAFVQKLEAATGEEKTFAVHKGMGVGFTAVGNAYAIVTDLSNLDMMHKTTGVASATYADCAIEFTADGQNTDWALATIPGLEATKEYAIAIYETSGTPAAGDTCIIKPAYYDPVTGRTYGSYNPGTGGVVFTRDRY